MKVVLASILISFIASISTAEEIDVRQLAEGAKSPAASIEDFSWMAGYWEGEGFGGKVVELIAPPASGQMMGAFYSLKPDGAVSFYEFYLFIEEGDTVVLRMKHFSAKLSGWEEKDEYVEFPLVAIEDRAAYFDRISFVQTAPGRLEAAVDFSNGGIERFYYTKKPLSEH